MSTTSDRKRRLDLGDALLQKQAKEITSSDINPWTNRPYSAKYHSILEKRLTLPVYLFRQQLLDTVAANQIVVVEGTTGSGKTTQIPQFLVEIGRASCRERV